MKIAAQNSNSENVENESKNTANFITELTQKESDRQKNCLNLIASENLPSPKILELMGSTWSNKYGEGYPGKRYYAGNQFTDELESFIQKKALEVFDTQTRFGNLENGKLRPEFLGSTADYAVNVQVLSGSPANAMVFLSVLEYGDTILSLNLANGGHLSHLHATSNWNKFFKLVNYDVKLVENSKGELPNLDLEINLGKAENSNKNSDDLEKIIKQIQTKIQEFETKNSQNQKPFIIAIDGRGGSGKSSLAKKIGEKLVNSVVIEREQFLEFMKGMDTKSENWNTNNFEINQAELEQEISKNQDKKVIILEGLKSFEIEEKLEIDLRIWLEIDSKIGNERAKKRDLQGEVNEVGFVKFWQEYENYAEKYILEKPQKKADLVISTEKADYEILEDNLQNNLGISEFTKDLSGLKLKSKTIHLIGLFSDSDKYSRLEDWAIMIEKAAQNGAEKIVLHLIADGIDTDKKLVDIWQEFTKTLNQKSKNQKSELLENMEKLENKIYLGSLTGIDFWQKNIFTCFKALFENPRYANLSFWLKEKNYGKNYEQGFITTKSSNLQKNPNLDLIKSQIENTVDFRSENYQETDQNYLLHRFSFLENFGEFGTLENSNIINKNETLYLINHTAQGFEKFTQILVDLNKEFDLNLNILANFESEIEGVKSVKVEEFENYLNKDTVIPYQTKLTNPLEKEILGFVPQFTPTKNVVCYEIDEVDFEAKLIESKPKLTILGGSSYPRLINFAKLTQIAHKHGSLVLADVAHINGLIAAGLHFSPFQSGELADLGADFVTMTTHKTFRGPRSAMIFMKKEFEKTINKTIFPGTSGGPHFNKIAAIGQACLEILGEDSYPDGVIFEEYSQNVLDTCKALENSLAQNGLEIISPTQNHLCLFKLPENSDSLEIQQKLEKIGIICNRNILPFDPKGAWKPSGLRLGTAALASRGLTTSMAQDIGKIISDLIFERETEQNLQNQVDTICQNLNWFY